MDRSNAVGGFGKGKKMTVVMGGSFNPPTLAHLRLMRAAIDALGSHRGIFVPSSHGYVSNKMSKKGAVDAVIPQETRLEMLRAMMAEDSRMTLDELELHRLEKSYTYETLLDIAEKYPEDEICFLAGGDKVDIFPKWHRIEELLQRFRIITVKREGYEPAAEIAADVTLSKYADRFYIIDAPEGLEGVSSSAIRAAMSEGRTEEARLMCHPEVFRLLCENARSTGEIICGFFGNYRFLSNFWESPVEYGGITYLNNEAAFQAQKCISREDRLWFAALPPKDAKKLGRQVSLRADWESVKLSVMEDIARAKFTQSPELARLLLETGDRPLIEGNTWGDTFWGVSLDSYEGKNHLGRALMKVRAELRAEACPTNEPR